MSQVKYVTSNIHKIEKNQGRANNSPEPGEGEKNVSAVREKRERLSAATEEALQRRHEEFLRFRKDLLFRMEKLACNVKNAAENGEKLLQESQKLEEEVNKCRREWEECSEPDPDDSRYQITLAEKCRALDLMRLTLIQLESRLENFASPLSGSGRGAEKETNLFAQMNSLTRKQLLRLGFWIFFPAMLVLVLSALVVGLLVLATFRVGL